MSNSYQESIFPSHRLHHAYIFLSFGTSHMLQVTTIYWRHIVILVRHATITLKRKPKFNFLCDAQYFHRSEMGNSIILGKVTNSIR